MQKYNSTKPPIVLLLLLFVAPHTFCTIIIIFASLLLLLYDSGFYMRCKKHKLLFFLTFAFGHIFINDILH